MVKLQVDFPVQLSCTLSTETLKLQRDVVASDSTLGIAAKLFQSHLLLHFSNRNTTKSTRC